MTLEAATAANSAALSTGSNASHAEEAPSRKKALRDRKASSLDADGHFFASPRSERSKSANSTLVLAEAASLKPGLYHYRDVASIDELIENNYREIDETGKDFIKLRDSILLTGVKEPIHVFLSRAEGGEPVIKIVAGHHRTRVVKTLRGVGNPAALPVILEVADKNETQMAVIGRCVTSAVTNTLKKKLGGMERAKIIQELLASGMKANQVTLAIGCNKKLVERANNLNSLPIEAQDFLWANQSRIRENRAFEIAQVYKKRLADAGGKDNAPAEALAELLVEVMGLLRAEANGKGPAAKSSSKNIKSSPALEVPAGFSLINDEKFKARIVLLDKVPKGLVEKILSALEESKIGAAGEEDAA